MNYFTKIKNQRGFLNKLFLFVLLLTGSISAFAQDEVVATFKSAEAVTNSGYTGTYGRDDWYINMAGNNISIGFNDKNCTKISENLGTGAKATNYGIVVKSKKILNSVNKITFFYYDGKGDGGKIYLASSNDNTNWTPVELKAGEGLSAQGATVSKNKTLTFEFDKIDAAYYGIILDSELDSEGTTTAAYRFDNVVITFINATTGPSIKLNPAEKTYSFDQTSGSFNYTITNPVASTNVTTTPNNGWITSATANETEGTVSFTMEKNETGADREGTITVKYGDAPEATFTVIQKRELPKYTITWSVNGVTTTETVEEGTALTFAAPTDNIPAGYEFMGWYGSTLEPQNNAPTYVTEATATADATYYAVFAKNDGGTASKTVTLEPKHTTANTTYADHQYTDSEGNTWNAHTSEQTNVIRYGLRSTGDTYPYFESPEFGGNITKIEIRTFNSSKSDRVFYIDGENSKDAAHIGTITAPHNEECTTIYSFEPTTEIKKFYLHASEAVGFNYLAVTYGGATYSDFRTSVTPVETMTIDMTNTYDNDGFYYRTFSSTKAFKVPADLTVSEIAVIDGELLVDDYKEGDVVAANTGVMLWSLEQKEFTVDITTEEGTTILGADNMLRPSGDAGITAADMAAKDAKCIFYRLTTNKDDVLCYCWGAADGAAFALDANKAYLAVPTETAQGIKAYSFGGNGTTAIDKITDTISAKAERKVYNLQGQRVSGTPAPGLYIVNGKKVVIK